MNKTETIRLWESQLHGLDVETAEAEASKEEWVIRVVREDGVVKITTRDYNPKRLNISINGGLVMGLFSIS